MTTKKQAIFGTIVLFLLPLAAVLCGCQGPRSDVGIKETKTPTTLMIPNDAEAKELFRDVEELSKTRAQYVQLRQSLTTLAPKSHIMLERDNLAGANYNYVVYCAAQILETQAVLLTNDSSDGRDQEEIRQFEIDLEEYTELLEILSKTTGPVQSALCVETEAILVQDGRVYCLSWCDGKQQCRVWLDRDFMGGMKRGPKKLGISSVDSVVERLNQVVDRLTELDPRLNR